MLLLICSIILYLFGCWFVFISSRNVLSPSFLSCGFLGLAFVGSLFYLIEFNNWLTPITISTGVFSFGIGTLFYSAISKFRPSSELQNYKNSNLVFFLKSSTKYNFALILLLFISSLLTTIYFIKNGIVINSLDPAKLRTEGVEGNGFYLRGFLTFLPLTFLFTWIYQKNNPLGKGKLLFIFVWLVAIIALWVYGSRGAITIYLLPFLIIFGLLSKRKVKISVLIYSLILLIIIATAFQFSYMEYANLTLAEAFTNVLSRLTMSQAFGVDFIINSYVPLIGYGYGEKLLLDFQGILSTLRLAKTPEYTFQQELFVIFSDNLARAKFTISSLSIGDLYADFGFIGVMIGMFLYGVLTQFLYVKLLRSTKTDIKILFISYIQYIIITAHIGGGFFGNFANKGITLGIYFILFFIISYCYDIFFKSKSNVNYTKKILIK